MVDLNSAEATTKYLRSKNIKPEEAVKTAHALLDGSLDVFLINKHHFVFDLLCDRISDFTGKDFKGWKFDPLIWSLWEQVWQFMEKSPLDLEVRTRSFKRVKLVSVMTAVIEKAHETESTDLLKAMFTCVISIIASGYVEVDEFTVTGLLAAYSKWLETTNLAEPSVNKWTSVVLNLYELPRKSANYKPSKKSTASYYSSVLPRLLNFLSREEADELKPSRDQLAASNKTFMFEVESTRALISHMDDVLAYEGLTDSAVKYLFQDVIAHSAATDIASCEAVFISITKSPKFSNSSESLLQTLSNVNKALSSDFYEKLYENEMANQPIKWGLIGTIAPLSPELAQQKTDDIVKGSKDLGVEELTMLVAGLAKGYIKAREFHDFVSRVYPSAVGLNSKWSDESIVGTLASRVEELSNNQISSTLENALKSDQEEVVVLILRGLLMCSTSKQEAAARVVREYKTAILAGSEVAYYALCLFVDELGDDEALKTVSRRDLSSKFDLYLALRVAELTGDLTTLKEKQLKKFVKKASSEDTLQFFRRWLVVLETFESVHVALLQRLLETATKDEFLSVFNEEGVFIYELPGFLSSLSKFVAQKADFPYLKEILCILPITIYRKFFSDLTDKLCEEALTSMDAKEILKHIFQDASGASSLEKDYKLFTKFIAADESSLTIEVGQLIWDGHINRYKDQSSREFVNNVIESVVKSFKKKGSESSLRICQIVLNGEKVKDEEFQASVDTICNLYVEHITKSSDTSHDQLAVLSSLPIKFTGAAQNMLKAYIKSLKSKELTPANKNSLLLLVTKITALNFHGALFISSLYLAIFEEIDLKSQAGLKENLSSYFKQLPQEDFHQIYLHLSASCEDAPSGFLDPIITLITLLAHQLDKSLQKEHTALFVGTVSIVSLRVKDIEREETLLGFTTTVTSMLSDHAWLFSQYAVELLLATVGRILKKSKHRGSSTVYISLVNLVSYIILFHRFRLTSRYHLLIGILTEIMRQLSTKEASDEAAGVFGRVLVTLSEPPIQRSTKENDSLTSKAAIYKRAIRKQAHVLLINYVHMQVSTPLRSSITDLLMPGIYSVFSLLSKVELQLTNQLLDSSGRVYFKNLYQSYKDFGKWKN